MTCWPHENLPGAGKLDEHELDAACWRKRQIKLTADQCHAVDETAGLCGVCGGECPTPQACEMAEGRSGFPLGPLLARHAWLGPVLVACVVVIWTCLDGYLATLP